MSVTKIYQGTIPIRRIYLDGKIVWQARDEPVHLNLAHLAEHNISCVFDSTLTTIAYRVPSYDINLVVGYDGQYIATIIRSISMDADHQLIGSDDCPSLLSLIDVNTVATDIVDLIISTMDNALTVCDVVPMYDENVQKLMLDVSSDLLLAESKRIGCDVNALIYEYILAQLATPLGLRPAHIRDISISAASTHALLSALARSIRAQHAHELHESYVATAVPGYSVDSGYDSIVDVLCRYYQTGVAGLATIARHNNRVAVSCESILDGIAAEAIDLTHLVKVLIGQISYQLGTQADGLFLQYLRDVSINSESDGQFTCANGLSIDIVRDLDIRAKSDSTLLVENSIVLNSEMVDEFIHVSEHELTPIEALSAKSRMVELFDHESEYDLSSITILSMGCYTSQAVNVVDESYLSDKPEFVYPEQVGSELYIPQVYSAVQTGTTLVI